MPKPTLPAICSRLALAVATAVMLVAFGFHGSGTPASAAAPATVNFQARLMTGAGAIVPDGNYNVEFKLYNALTSSGSSQGSCTGDTSCLWVEDYTGANTVHVANGYLTVNLGSVSALPAGIWNQQLWLGMAIKGPSDPSWDSEMAPRLQLTAVPAAFELASTNGSNSGTLGFVQPTANESILLPAESGTQYVCYQNDTACGFAPGSASSYVQLQGSTPGTVQTGNLNISGTAIAGTLQAPTTYTNTLDSVSSGGSLSIGTTKATGGITIGTSSGGNTYVGSAKTFIGTTGTVSGISSTLTVLASSAGVNGINVRAAASPTVDIIQVQDSTGACLWRISTIGSEGSCDTSNAGSGVSTLKSGNVSGTSTAANSGAVTVTSGSAADGSTGKTVVKTGDATGGGSGQLQLFTGADANNFTTGAVSILTGTPTNVSGGTGASGAISIATGNVLTGNGSSGSISIDSGTSFGSGVNGTVSIGNANASALQIGNNSSNPTITIDSGTGTIAIGTGAQARTINLGTGNAAQAVTVGSTNSSSTAVLQGGGTKVSVGNSGGKLQTSTNSTTAFQIQNAAGTSNLLVADTVNNILGVGMAPSTAGLGATLQVAGTADVIGRVLQVGPTSYASPIVLGGPNSGYVVIDKAQAGSDASLLLRDQGAIRGEIGLTTTSDDIHLKVVSGAAGSESFTDSLILFSPTSTVGTPNDAEFVGSLGIGTATPQNLLHVDGASNATRLGVKIENDGSTAGSTDIQFAGLNNNWVTGSDFGINGNDNFYLQDAVTGTVPIFVKNTTNNSSGLDYVGLGNNTNPQYQLDVSGTIRAIAATSGGIGAIIQANAAGAGDILDLQNGAGTPVATFGSTGAVLLKNSANSTTAFQIQGASTTTSLFTADTTNSKITITAASATTAVLTIANSDGTPALEVRAGGSGNYNSFIGVSAGISNTTGQYNAVVGDYSLFQNTSGSYNAALGEATFQSNQTGSYNAAVGYGGLNLNVSGSGNTAIGAAALYSQTGSDNTAVGFDAGYQDANGFVTLTSLQNATAIGYYAQVQANNSLVLGGSGSSAVNVGIGTTVPLNTLSVSPVQYSTGTASQSGATITGSGTTWTSAMVGDQIVFANGANALITGFTSATSLTASVSQTESAQNYRLQYSGLQVSSTGNVGVGQNTPSRLLDVAQNSAQTTAPMELLEQNGAGDASIEFKSASSGTSFYVGQDTSNSGSFTINSSTAATPSGVGFVQATTASNNASGTSLSTAFSSNTTSGNTIIIGVSFDTAGGTSFTCSDNKGDSYSNVVSRVDGASVQEVGICYASNIVGGATTVTVTFAGNTFRRIFAQEYAGLAGTTDGSNSNIGTATGSANGVTSNSITTTTSGDLVFGFVNDTHANNTITAGTGFTARAITSDSESQDQTQAGAGGVASLSTFSNTDTYIAVVAAFKPTAGTLTNTFNNSLFTLSQTGAAKLQNSTNSMNAFQIQTASGASLFNVDTVNDLITSNASILFQPITDSTTAFEVNTAGGTPVLTIDTSGQNITLGSSATLNITNTSPSSITGPAWTAYTPTWVSTLGTSPSIGNGALSGRYYKVGRVVNFSVSILSGSTTNFGSTTGEWDIGVPVTSGLVQTPVTLRVLNAVSGNFFICAGLIGVSSNAISQIFCNAGTGYSATNGTSNGDAIRNNVPFTWSGAGNAIQIEGTYESAS